MSDPHRDIGGPDEVPAEALERWLETGRLAELGLLSAELVHELRQPAFAIRATAQLLERKAGPDCQPLVAQLLAQAGALQTLIERYAGSGGSADHELRPMPLASAVEAGVLMLSARARHLQRALLFAEVSPTVAVLADPLSIQQIVGNLVANALDACGSTVTVQTSGAVLTVRDDGPGIAPDVMARMFAPFFSTKDPGQGTGLGLPIARQLASRVGADLTCHTGPEGSVFTVRFPPMVPQVQQAKGKPPGI